MAAVSRSLCCNTGRQIDGVWHTGIVVYGEEFFYGGAGIHSCSPVSEICFYAVSVLLAVVVIHFYVLQLAISRRVGTSTVDSRHQECDDKGGYMGLQ